MILSAVVVLYNPTNQNIEQISQWSKFVNKVIIVDNSANDNSQLVKLIANAEYIALLDNKGIAKALNIGIDRCKQLGFEYCLTMDQDSIWSDELLNKYFDLVESYTNDKSIASFAPFPLLNESKIRKLQKKIKKNHVQDDILEVDRVICSGNIISVPVWYKLNGFNEKLFIDEVDNEYCYRLRQEGYRIFQFNKIVYNHVIGNEKKRVLPGDSHNSFRLYYIIRNRLYIQKYYKYFAKKYNYKRITLLIIIQKILFGPDRSSNIKAIKKAIKDYRQMDVN